MKSGDTLSKIASTYGTTVDTLAEINAIQNRNPVSYTHLDVYKRQAYAGSSDSFCLVTTDGTPGYNDADLSGALAPGFAV